jgi:hypothetical protein
MCMETRQSERNLCKRLGRDPVYTANSGFRQELTKYITETGFCAIQYQTELFNSKSIDDRG